MNLLRSDQLTSLQDLLVECRKSVDYFNDAADFIEDPVLSELLLELSDSRSRVTRRLERAVRELGDLPASPDADRETGEMLFNHARASLSEDKAGQVIRQRLKTEQELLQQIEKCYETGVPEVAYDCLRALGDNVRTAIDRLQGR